MDGFSYQGISDEIAAGFIARHGNASWPGVSHSLKQPGDRCLKLADFESYRGCRYRKASRTCGNPDQLPTCPVPSLPLRKGILNEQAFSLFFFIRDRCAGDLVAFIDEVIGSARRPRRISERREALLMAFGEVQGVSDKLLSMMLATLLIGGDNNRRAWVAVGQSMVAIDTLVHNFLHRTGIIAAYELHHPYGQRCFGAAGCEAIIRDLAGRFDARVINPRHPNSFPRLVQHAIWRFCAQQGLSICNGRNISDDAVCELSWCPLWGQCSRLSLRAG